MINNINELLKEKEPVVKIGKTYNLKENPKGFYTLFWDVGDSLNEIFESGVLSADEILTMFKSKDRFFDMIHFSEKEYEILFTLYLASEHFKQGGYFPRLIKKFKEDCPNVYYHFEIDKIEESEEALNRKRELSYFERFEQ